jgi:biopolymer transport protein ExbB
MRRFTLVLFIFLLTPLSAQAWWNKDWSYRKQITLDTSETGANIADPLENVPVLVRLHTGNFGYFLDIQPKGQDIRFIAADDQTPLNYHIEKFDPINEMALIWVQVPQLQAASKATSFWMYYGNTTAVAAENVAATFDTSQVLDYHFSEQEPSPRDATAYGNNAAQFNAEVNKASLIGAGVSFKGENSFTIPASPSLSFDPETGWTWSAWVKIDADQTDALLLERSGDAGRLLVGVDGTSVYGRFEDPAGNRVETPRNSQLSLGAWHQVALTLTAQRMSVFIDGNESAYVEATFPAMQGDVIVGAGADGQRGFTGGMDEVGVANVARSATWLRTAVQGQGQVGKLLVYGEDGAQEGSAAEPSYFVITLRNVTPDGWAVIVVLSIMAAISWVVMISKGLAVARVSKDNAAFQGRFAELGFGDVDDLDAEESEDEKQLRESPLLLALSGNHEHFESSTLYRIYHAGVQEMHHRMPKAVGAQTAGPLELKPQAIDAIRATMDGTLTRENQKLNSQMVLLTIAISGGPFLGLLGTVVGVMITFAAIAASGDVNVNAIAPGIAAALVATVAGLAVAIPALFGYNYLGSRIKEISADMHVFVDEFVAKIAEQHS